MDNQSSTIEKISSDLSYLRGRFDTIIPELQRSNQGLNTMLDVHSKQISELESDQNFIKGKVVVAGGLAGIILSVAITWIGKHF